MTLCLPFPLRPNFLAQIVIPRDMTKAEADRLCAMVMSLASDPTPKQKLDALLGDAPRLEPNEFTTPMLKEERT